MAEQIEQQVSEIFRQDAARAPALDAGVPHTVARIVRRRRVRRGLAAGLLVAALAIGTPIGHSVMSKEPARRSGTLTDLNTADCSPPESLTTVPARSTAFDGTVTAIAQDTQTADRSMRTAAVTFTVHHWFRGGTGATATAIMPAPLPPEVYVSEYGPAYTLGTRLLVIGAARPGSGRLQAWGCGYTRYYDEQTAAAWRHSVRGG